MNDMDLLKDPKKWKELLKNKRKAVGGMVSTSGKAKGPGSSWRTAELTAGPLLALIAIIGVANRSFELIALGFGGLMILFWYTNHQREKPLMPLPPPPFYGQGQ
jgi:hypothetical protein